MQMKRSNLMRLCAIRARPLQNFECILPKFNKVCVFHFVNKKNKLLAICSLKNVRLMEFCHLSHSSYFRRNIPTIRRVKNTNAYGERRKSAFEIFPIPGKYVRCVGVPTHNIRVAR